MNVKFATAAVVATQVLLSNFCFMPMVFAGETMPMDHEMEEMEQVMEMVMPPMYPMSTVHCDGCVTIMRPKHHSTPMAGGMPCNDGHCLSGHSPSTAVMTQPSQKDVLKIALRPVFFFLVPQTEEKIETHARAGPDTHPLLAQMVVMRE